MTGLSRSFPFHQNTPRFYPFVRRNIARNYIREFPKFPGNYVPKSFDPNIPPNKDRDREYSDAIILEVRQPNKDIMSQGTMRFILCPESQFVFGNAHSSRGQ